MTEGTVCAKMLTDFEQLGTELKTALNITVVLTVTHSLPDVSTEVPLTAGARTSTFEHPSSGDNENLDKNVI